MTPWPATASLIGGLTLSALASAHAVRAQTAGDQSMAGRAFAESACASCHAVGRTGASPLKAAPPFGEIMARYPAEDLEEALAEGIVVGHPAMPNFQLQEPELGNLVAYLRTLQPDR